MDQLREGVFGAIPLIWGWGDRAAIGKEHRMDGWVLFEPAEQLFRIAGAFTDRWPHRFFGVGLQRLPLGEALDVLRVVRVEMARLIPHKADHGDADPGLAQFLQQPITYAVGISRGSWAAENMGQRFMGDDWCHALDLGLANQLPPRFEVLLLNGFEQRLPFLGGVAKAELLEPLIVALQPFLNRCGCRFMRPDVQDEPHGAGQDQPSASRRKLASSWWP